MAEPDFNEEEMPPFRWNWQALVISALTVAMLVVPIAGVAYFFQGSFRKAKAPQPTPIPTVDPRPLASALENAAAVRLGGDQIKLDAESELRLSLPVDEIPARLTRIAEQAGEAGGTALEMPLEKGDARRLMISIPASRRALLRRAINGEKIDFSAVPAGNGSEILNVILTPRT